MSLDKYRRRLQRNGGTVQDDVLSYTKITASRQFDSSLFSERVLINDSPTLAIVTQGKTSEDKQILLQPDSNFNIGDIVKIGDSDYLILDFKGEGINEIYPTGTLKVCNATFPIISDKTKILKRDSDGNIVLDEYDEPIIIEFQGETKHIPCISENQYRVNNSNEQIMLPEGEIMVTLPYSTEYSIKLGDKFEMYGFKYEILNVDPTKVIRDKGIITLRAKSEGVV